MIDRLKGATIAITNRVRLGRPELERLPDLKMIAVAATGYDHIDIAACRELGIVVTNLGGWCDCSVSEHVFAFALALRRNLSEQAQVARDATWHRSATGSLLCTHPARDLCGDTMGIIGFGRIGKRVATLAQAFGMKVLAAERKSSATVRPGRVEFPEVLHRSDIVSLHCPLNDETRYLIGEAELRSMKRDAILINCARGELIDNRALYRALTSGILEGAGLDDVEGETSSSSAPLLNLHQTNLIVTPRVAWASRQAIEEFRRQLADNLEAFMAGTPRNVAS